MGLPRGRRKAVVNVAAQRLPQFSDASACGTGADQKAGRAQKDGAPDERWLSSCRACAVIEPCEHPFKDFSYALRIVDRATLGVTY